MRHYLRGWSHLGHSTHHLRGCLLAQRDSLPTIFPKGLLRNGHNPHGHLPRRKPLVLAECGRLFQGIRDITGTDTCFFIKLTNIPKDIKITYGKIVCDYKPQKQEKERVRLTVGGDRLDYSGDIATPTADITTFKIIINSTLSTEEAAVMMMMDIKKIISAPHCRDLNT
jgi:hypothetical protein